MSFPLKSDYRPGKGPCQIRASDLRTIANMLNGLQVVLGGDAPFATVTPPDQHGRGWTINLPASGSGTGNANTDDFAFGYSVSGAVVTVNGGQVKHGTRSPISVAGGDVTIGAGETRYIYVAYTFGASAALSSDTSEPEDTEEVHHRLLHVWTLVDGVATLAAGGIRHLGDIVIPGAYA